MANEKLRQIDINLLIFSFFILKNTINAPKTVEKPAIEEINNGISIFIKITNKIYVNDRPIISKKILFKNELVKDLSA